MTLTRRSLLQNGAMLLSAPALRAVAAALPYARATDSPDTFQPTWDSLRDNYHSPAWLTQSRLGIFIHWGLFSVPAHGNEWYPKHMYTSVADIQWHTEHYGAPDKFGYKDFIPLFKAEKWQPDQWAALFKQAGAGFVIPVAEHSDGWLNWDSELTPYCAGKMGPKRDLIGDLGKAVRAQQLRFGVSDHSMEHHTFMYPKTGLANDQFDPKYARFYGPPQPGEMNDGLATPEFQAGWLARLKELITKYSPDLIYLDNGVNDRAYDQVKLEMAAFYYNHATGEHKDVSLVTKDKAYLAGSISTFEKSVRAPKWIYPGPWLSDDTISTGSWGYTSDLHLRGTQDILTELVELTSRGGGLLLNISPKADGTIPDDQQSILREIGAWMKANDSAINGTRPWIVYGEGPHVPAVAPADWAGGSSADQRNYLRGRGYARPTESDFRFTTRGGKLFVFGFGGKLFNGQAKIQALRSGGSQVERVTHVATGAAAKFKQAADGLTVEIPGVNNGMPYVIAVEGVLPLGV